MAREYHTPALADEVVQWLNLAPGSIAVDGTCGGGGHALLLAQAVAPSGTLVAIDRDPEALAATQARLSGLDLAIVCIHGNFDGVRDLVQGRGIPRVDAILFDLGVASHQLDTGGRGFSFRADAPLDMRMDATQGETCADVLARLDELELERALRELSDERWASRIARFVVTRRAEAPVLTTGDLADIVASAIPRGAWPRDVHPATRTFLALRCLVNDELGSLQRGIGQAIDLLRPGGRLAVICYQGLEEAVVKKAFNRLAGRCECPPGFPECRCGARAVARVLTRKAVAPTEDEVQRNRRARSARLRVIERL